TIKGGAGFLDFPPMVAICHAVEDRLNAARSGEVPLDAEAFDGAQQSLDLLVDLLDCVAAGEVLMPAPQGLLDALRAGASATATAQADASGPAAGGEDIDDLGFEALLGSLHGHGGLPGIQADRAPGAPAVSACPPAGRPPPATAAFPASRLMARLGPRPYRIPRPRAAPHRCQYRRPLHPPRRASPLPPRTRKTRPCAWTCAGSTRWSTWSASSCSRATGS